MNFFDLLNKFKHGDSATKNKFPERQDHNISPVSAVSMQKRLERLYKNKGYKAIPKVPSEKEAERILTTYRNFPASIVPKEYMDPINFNGQSLLRGEILVLWWTTSRKNISNPPQYFLYQYGVNYYESISKLYSLNLITSDNKLTELGKGLIDKSAKIIWQHKAEKAIEADGTVKYSSSHGVSGKLLVVPKAKYPKSSRKDYLDNYFYKSNQRIQYLWNAKQYELCKKEAMEQISQGNKYPIIYNILAMMYREQKRYQDEIDIMKKGIDAQISIHNPGVAIRDFRKRIERAEELKSKKVR